MIQVWPLEVEDWLYVKTVDFPDEPGIWWWTDTHVLLRGVGKRPNDAMIANPKKEFSGVTMLDVRRTRSKWEPHHSKWSSVEEVVRASKNDFHQINAKYHRLLEHWPKPVKWLVPVKGDNWCAPALACEMDSQQIVAVVMPMNRMTGGDR